MRVWHPVTIAAALAVLAAVADVSGVALWLVMGAAAGFATSGST
jgi:hypothetical protein